MLDPSRSEEHEKLSTVYTRVFLLFIKMNLKGQKVNFRLPWQKIKDQVKQQICKSKIIDSDRDNVGNAIYWIIKIEIATT